MFHKIFHFGQEHSNNKIIATIIRHIMIVIYHCDIPLSKNIDKTVYFCHNGFGCVINPKAIIQRKVTIQHGVTIGEKYLDSGVPARIIMRNKKRFCPVLKEQKGNIGCSYVRNKAE